MVNLVLVLGDQLSPGLSALQAADKSRDIVVMAEVLDEASYVPHHPKKIAFVFAAMRKFAQQLQDDGWQVCYTRLDASDNPGSIPGVLLAQAAAHKTSKVIATESGEWRLIHALQDVPLDLTMLPDDRFVATHSDFETWAEGRKTLRMEYFYREMRRGTGLLMEGDKPAGDQWNFDHDNRKPAPGSIHYAGPMRFKPDDITAEVLDLVAARFANNFGRLDDFWFATDSTQAKQHFAHWLRYAAPYFGDYQDAMLMDEPFMYHGFIGLYLNAGLLDPLEVCRAVEAAWRAGDVPLNAAEGFVRQIIGWREYVRGIYFLEGPAYVQRNALEHSRALPQVYWGGATKMRCMEQSVAQTRDEAYAHHIQRLMVTGNFALLAGIAPGAVHAWYLAVYADAYEWVEAPNTIGMSQFADGGVIASKPYISSGNYIHKMSNYCKSCAYRVQDKVGPDACPFNLLYWHFLDRHRDRFKGNARMGQMYRVWDKMDAERRASVLSQAEQWLGQLDAGAPV